MVRTNKEGDSLFAMLRHVRRWAFSFPPPHTDSRGKAQGGRDRAKLWSLRSDALQGSAEEKRLDFNRRLVWTKSE